MRTGARGIFPAYYAIEVTKEPEHMAGSVPSPALAPRGPHVSPALITPGLTGAPDLSLPGRGPEKREAQPSRVNPGGGGGGPLWVCLLLIPHFLSSPDQKQ